jgi:hypothetical protein
MFIDDFTLSVTTTGHTLSGVVLYPNTAQTPLQGVTLKLKNSTGTVVGTSTTNGTGHYSFADVSSGNYTLEATTAKSWGGVTAGDVLLYKKHIINVESLNGIYLAAGDVNASGSTTALDVLLMGKRIAAIINSFPAGDWLFNSVPFTIGGSDLIQDFYGISYGDANGSYVPYGK